MPLYSKLACQIIAPSPISLLPAAAAAGILAFSVGLEVKQIA